MDKVLKEESKLDVEELVRSAMNEVEVIEL